MRKPFTSHYIFVVNLYKKSIFLYPIFYSIMQNKQTIVAFTSQGKKRPLQRCASTAVAVSVCLSIHSRHILITAAQCTLISQHGC